MIDYELFNLINGLAGHYVLLDYFMIFMSNYGIFIIGLLLLLTRDHKAVAEGFLAFLIASFVDMLINAVYPTPRPFVEHEVNLLVAKEPSPGFPSGHSLTSFALATATLMHHHRKNFGKISMVIAFLVSFSRIYVGVHYPSDVLGGMILGFGVSYLLAKSRWYMLIPISPNINNRIKK